MPLSSSVHCAQRHLRTIVGLPPAGGNGKWPLSVDLDKRIADVNVRTGAHALSEVHSSLLLQPPSLAHRAATIQGARSDF